MPDELAWILIQLFNDAGFTEKANEIAAGAMADTGYLVDRQQQASSYV